MSVRNHQATPLADLHQLNASEYIEENCVFATSFRKWYVKQDVYLLNLKKSFEAQENDSRRHCWFNYKLELMSFHCCQARMQSKSQRHLFWMISQCNLRQATVRNTNTRDNLASTSFQSSIQLRGFFLIFYKDMN